MVGPERVLNQRRHFGKEQTLYNLTGKLSRKVGARGGQRGQYLPSVDTLLSGGDENSKTGWRAGSSAKRT